jgi:hypothetical protein
VYGLSFKSIWRGSVNSDWNEPLNWEYGKVSDSFTDAIIDNGVVLLNGNGFCRTINVKPGVRLSIGATGNLMVNH